MYNILEQAIIDAKALREAALKNAETAVLEKYSDEVKGAIDIMLEAEVSPVEEAIIVTPGEEAAAPALAAAEGEDLCGCPDAGEEVEWELSLDDLKAMSDAMPEGEPMEQDALAAEFGAEEEEEDELMLEEEIELVFEDELDEISLPGTAAAGMDAAIAEMEREELAALKAKIEAYIMKRRPATGRSSERIETPRMGQVGIPGLTAESKLKEMSIPGTAAAGRNSRWTRRRYDYPTTRNQ